MILNLPYGQSRVALDLRGFRISQLQPSAPRAQADLSGLIVRALENPISGRPLGELCQESKRVTIVVPDGTRKADLPVVLPAILGFIFDHNRDADVTILIACGTHRPPTDDERAVLLGEIPSRVAVINHDSRDESALVDVGRLENQAAIRINRCAADAEILITVGAIKHHYFAGFGGGPKMIFPGVAGYEEIQANHSLVLERSGQSWSRNHSCEPGVLDGNPIAQHIADAADLRPPDVALCLVAGVDGHIAWAGAGLWRDAFAEATEVARSWYESSSSTYQMMIASGGGAPYDSTLIQAHKALDAGARFLREGGEFLFIASMEDGAGAREMQPFLDDPDPTSILRSLGKQWIQYGHTTLRIVEKTSRFKIHLLSRLDPDLVRRLGFHPVSDPEVLIESWRERSAGETVGVMTGAAVYPRSAG